MSWLLTTVIKLIIQGFFLLICIAPPPPHVFHHRVSVNRLGRYKCLTSLSLHVQYHEILLTLITQFLRYVTVFI
jgi:hypothetical protein